MTDAGAISNALSRRDGDMPLSTELLLAVFTATDADLPEQLTTLATNILKVDRGGFYPESPPDGKMLVESVRFEDKHFGC